MEGVVTPIAKDIGETIAKFLKREFNYLCCFDANVDRLKREAEQLDNEKVELQMKVNAASSNAAEVVPKVKTWLSHTDEIQTKKQIFDAEISNAQIGCLNIVSRYSLSKKATETAEAMEKLRKDSMFHTISLPAPPLSTVPIQIDHVVDFDSRRDVEDRVVNALSQPGVNIVGIGGMGGVGKTTMAEKIMNRVMTEKIFNEAVVVVVAQHPDLMMIQLELADSLGLLKDLKSHDTLQARAHELFIRLTGNRRILIVLDDIWEKFKLKDLGIPCDGDSSGCSILLTSRDAELLKQMNANKVFVLKILPPTEAWSLFRDKAGTCVEDPSLMHIAEEVVNECNGLPVAITVVGSALKDQEKPVWKDALHRLKRSNPTNMPHVLGGVYNPLRLSYEFLKDEDAKSLFLLCCIFPEDSSISLDDLALYCVGLKAFEDIDHLELVRYRVFTVVKELKDRFLLMDGYRRDEVKMHDVIRDVAIFIASEKGLFDGNLDSEGQRTKNCKWVSVFTRSRYVYFDDVITMSNIEKLQLLRIHGKGKLTINDTSSLERIRGLNVLSLRKTSAKSLLQSIKSLKSLRTLQLVKCSLKDLCSVGELSNLEILTCHGCDRIVELPHEIGKLTRLKLLDLSMCNSLEKIRPGVISKLVALEELKMLTSFDNWESTKVNEEERTNASLKELEPLRKLICLEIEIKNTFLVEEDIRLPSSLVNYKIGVGTRVYSQYEKAARFHGISAEVNFESWIYKLVRTTEDLYFNGEGLTKFDLSGVCNTVKVIEISSCQTLEEMLRISEKSSNLWKRYSIFSELQILNLSKLPKFREICDVSTEASISFRNLRELKLEKLPSLAQFLKGSKRCDSLLDVEINECHKLHNLFFLECGNDEFLQLQRLHISKCKKMERVMMNEDGTSELVLSKLKSVRLFALPSLTTFGKGIESIEFSSLEYLEIRCCEKLKTFVSSMESECSCNDNNNADESIHLFCNKKVKFGGLKTLVLAKYDRVSNIWCQQIPLSFFKTLKQLFIYHCGSIKVLFSSLIVENLVNLSCLYIHNCKAMERVIEIGREVEESYTIIFPSLEVLRLEHLPLLEVLCEWRFTIEFPFLEEIEILDCPRMKY